MVVNNVVIESTHYGIMNPDLPGGTCFGQPWTQIYHAGEDLYRYDGSSTSGALVTAVANGRVSYAENIFYPGRVAIIYHILPDGSVVYSVYSHLESLSVTAGDIVSAGDPVDTVLFQEYVGNYPEYHSTDDSHLHFEIKREYDMTYSYTGYPACNGFVPGRGYTYPEHPNVFPAIGRG